MKWWFLIGKLLAPIKQAAFWAASRVHKTTRPRVVMVRDNQILLVQDWGDSGWGLPGGGMQRGEATVDAAVREVKEEIGIELKASNLSYIETLDHGTYFAPLYLTKISEGSNLGIKLQKWEIRAAKWFSVDQLPLDHGTMRVILNALSDDKNLL